MLMQTIGLILASYLLVSFKCTRSIGLIGFALILLFRPVLFVVLFVISAALAAFIYFRKMRGFT